MLAPFTDKQKSLIVNNIVKACTDIKKLNRTGYKYLYLASGFIAHYDINGFVGYYTRHDLVTDILRNASANKWQNFREGDQNYLYYQSKADIYQRICSKLHNKTLNLYNT